MFLLHPSYFPLDMNSFQSPGVWLVVCTKSVGYLWFGTRVGPFRVISFGADTMKPADKKNYQNSFLFIFFSSSSYSENNRTTSDVHDIFLLNVQWPEFFFVYLSLIVVELKMAGFFWQGGSLNHVDDLGGGGFSKYPHKYITLIK